MNKILTVALIFSAAAAFGQKATIVKLPSVLALLEKRDDKIQVVNFWATWCGPCVAEMPVFEKLTAEKRANVSVTLISMDLDLDPNPEKVHKFVARKKIGSEVLILDEKDPGTYIDKIDPNWSGALPATIVINRKTGKRIFVGRVLKEGELERLIEKVKS